ncbi:MAG: hypothetical protein K8E66_07025, partial [Phycisphaerales bacterium]|nr:hypothetical protein [Phycisphaerales bacterium]
DQVICLECGADARSGKKRKTRVLKADKEPGERSGGITIDSTAYVFGFAVLAAIAIPIIAAVSQEAAVAAMAVGGIWYLVAFIMMIVAAFKDGDTVWGVAGICVLIPFVGGLLSFGFSFYYCIFGSERTAWKYNYWLALLSQITVYAVILSQHPQMFSPSGLFAP